jgi:hypothetical protein
MPIDSVPAEFTAVHLDIIVKRCRTSCINLPKIIVVARKCTFIADMPFMVVTIQMQKDCCKKTK